MGWDKGQFISEAFSELGLASYYYDLEPEQLESALRKMDSMVASWYARGIRIGYPLPSSPSDSALTTQTNVPDSANLAISLNLAVRLAPSVGKVLSPDTKTGAKEALAALLNKAVGETPRRAMPGDMPRGAGQKAPCQPFFPRRDGSLSPSDGDAQFDFE